MGWDNIVRLFNLVKKSHGIKDSFAVVVLGGLLGTLIVDISNFLLWKKGKTEMLYGHFAASMFMRPFRTNLRKNFILGQIFHMLTGIHFAIPIFYLLKKTGRDHLLLKGLVGGSTVWSTLYAFGIRMKMYTAKPHLTMTHYSYLWHNFLYGIATAYFMVWLAEPGMFPESNSAQTSQKTKQSEMEFLPSPSFESNKAESCIH